MTVLNETNHAAEFLLGELPSCLSRKEGTLASGNDLEAGAVLGVITASGKYAEHDPGAIDGTQDAVAVLYAGVDASDADQDCVVVYKDAAVNDAELVFITGISAGDRADAITSLESVGIVAR